MRSTKGPIERTQSAGEPLPPKQSSIMASLSDDEDSDSGSEANLDEDSNIYDNESVMANGGKPTGLDGSGLQSAMTKAKNREHARNTRIRRKNFIETLKDSIMLVASNRDDRDRERKAALSKLADQTAERKKVLDTWLLYRAKVETDVEKWRGILEEDFECVMPVTPYRSFPPHQVSDGRRRLNGIPDMIFDTLSLHVMVQSMILPRNSSNTAKVTLKHEVGEGSVMAGDVYMCKWSITTENIVARGGLFEVAKEGMLVARFAPGSAKLRSVDVSFDVMSYMQQLRRTSERTAFQVIPNLVYVASRPHASSEDAPSSPSSSSHASRSKSSPISGLESAGGSSGSGARGEALVTFLNTAEARVVISSDEPFTLSFVNKKFQDIFRQRRDVAEHITHNPVPLFYHLIRPGENLPAQLDNVLAHIKSKLPCSAILNCATAGNQRVTYPCMCCFFPLFADGAVQQYLVVIEVIGEVQHLGDRDRGTEAPASTPAPMVAAVVLPAEDVPQVQIRWMDAAQSAQSQSQHREGRSGSGGRSHASSLSAATELESRSSSSYTGMSNSRSFGTGGEDAAAAGVQVPHRSHVVGREKQFDGSWASSHSRSRDGQSDYTSAENASSSNISAMTWDQSGSRDPYDRPPRVSHKISRGARNSPSPESNTHKASRVGSSPPVERDVSSGSGLSASDSAFASDSSGSGSGSHHDNSPREHGGSGDSGTNSGIPSQAGSKHSSGSNSGAGSQGDSPEHAPDSDSPFPPEVSSATPPSDGFVDSADGEAEADGAGQMELSSSAHSSSGRLDASLPLQVQPEESEEEEVTSTGAAVDMAGNSEAGSVQLSDTLDYFLECGTNNSEGAAL